MAVRGVITYRGLAAHMAESTPAAQRAFDKSVRVALTEASAHWRDRYLPRHFKRTAFYEYAYAPRSKKYDLRKQRKFGHTDPLVLTGESKRTIMGTPRDPKIRRDGQRMVARIVFNAPKHFFQYNKSGGRKFIDKAAELLTISLRELRVLANVMDRAMTKTMNGFRETRTRVA